MIASSSYFFITLREPNSEIIYLSDILNLLNRNTLTANDKDPFRDCENLSSPIQMQLSLYPKFFSD